MVHISYQLSFRSDAVPNLKMNRVFRRIQTAPTYLAVYLAKKPYIVPVLVSAAAFTAFGNTLAKQHTSLQNEVQTKTHRIAQHLGRDEQSVWRDLPDPKDGWWTLEAQVSGQVRREWAVDGRIGCFKIQCLKEFTDEKLKTVSESTREKITAHQHEMGDILNQGFSSMTQVESEWLKYLESVPASEEVKQMDLTTSEE